MKERKYFEAPKNYIMPPEILDLKHKLMDELSDYTLALLGDHFYELIVKFQNGWSMGLIFYPNGLVVMYGNFFLEVENGRSFILEYSGPIVSRIIELAKEINAFSS